MGLFKESKCAKCGEVTKLLTRTKLSDGNYLCSKCMKSIPYYIRSCLSDRYTIHMYNNLLDYLKYSNETLRFKFHETQSYHSLHVDTESQIFFIGYGISDETLFLEFKNISRFNMLFKAEDVKDGILGTKVNGKIIFELGMDTPYFYLEEVLTSNAKAKAKKSFFGNNIEYENPAGMDDFLFYFNHCWEMALEEKASESYYDTYNDYVDESSSKLSQAMALFMLDDIETVSLEELKAVRNRLIKTFHPDLGAEGDVKHAQKINEAYEIIKEAIKLK